MTVTSRTAALVLLTASAGFVLALGFFGLIRHHLTPRENIAGCTGLVIAVAARLWLRRENRRARLAGDEHLAGQARSWLASQPGGPDPAYVAALSGEEVCWQVELRYPGGLEAFVKEMTP